jgi:ferredoxin
MAIIITEECINCGACEPECPNTAIYEGGVEWTWSGGTKLVDVELEDGTVINGKEPMAPVSDEFYYIVSDKCTECMGFHEEPQCALFVQLTVVFQTQSMWKTKKLCWLKSMVTC